MHRWILLGLILLGAIALDVTEPQLNANDEYYDSAREYSNLMSQEHYPGDIYHDATGWHHQCGLDRP